MEYMELLRQRSITSKGAGKNCPALKRYGIDVPRKAIADSCPVPQVLQVSLLTRSPSPRPTATCSQPQVM